MDVVGPILLAVSIRSFALGAAGGQTARHDPASHPLDEQLDAATWCRHLIPDGSVYAFLADHRHELFPPELFADLVVQGRSHPSVPPEVVATVMVLQVGERRVNLWQARRAAGTLADRPAAGGAVHGLGDEEVEAILELATEWGRCRPLLPQGRPPRLLPSPGVGVAGQRIQGAGRPRPGADHPAHAGAGAPHALAGLAGVPAQPGVGLPT
jgi:hypothetical protein